MPHFGFADLILKPSIVALEASSLLHSTPAEFPELRPGFRLFPKSALATGALAQPLNGILLFRDWLAIRSAS